MQVNPKFFGRTVCTLVFIVVCRLPVHFHFGYSTFRRTRSTLPAALHAAAATWDPAQ